MFMLYVDRFYFVELELLYDRTFNSKGFCCAMGWREEPTVFRRSNFALREQSRREFKENVHFSEQLLFYISL
jgi:hypothetical protein